MTRHAACSEPHRMYHTGDYVFVTDMPRRVLCRVAETETVETLASTFEILKLRPLEGPWPSGTLLIRPDRAVLPARPRDQARAPAPRPELRASWDASAARHDAAA